MKTANIAIFLGVLGCFLVSSHAPLHAQPTSTSITLEGDEKPWNQGVPLATREEARTLFLEGNKLFYLPLYKQAAEKYIAALAKWKHPAFHFNLALTQLNLGQEIEAHENLRQAIRQGEEPLGALQFHEAQKQFEDLERQLGRIRVTCPTAGAEVTLDGRLLLIGPGSYEGWVKAKTHEITARKQDYLSRTGRVAIGRGELKSLDLPLIMLSDAEQTRWAAWKPWAVVVAGAAVTAASGVFHARASHDFSSFDRDFQSQDCVTKLPPGKSPMCQDRKPDPPAPSNLYARLDAARRERTIALGGYIAGGSLLAVGFTLLYMNRPKLLERDAMKLSAGRLMTDLEITDSAIRLLITVSH